MMPAFVVPDVDDDRGDVGQVGLGVERGPHRRGGEPVVGCLDDKRVHLQQPQCVDDRGVGVGADDDAQPPPAASRPAVSWRSPGRPRAPTGCRPNRRRRSSRRADAGSPASSAISRSTVFSAAIAPEASSQEMPWIDAQDTSMSNSRLAFVGAAGMNPRNRGLSAEITLGAMTDE